MTQSYHYYLFHKPYGVLSQFSKEKPNHVTLADFLSLPKDVYPVGRLDKDSEGLLLLTNDNKLKTRLLNPSSKVTKTYVVQLDKDITDDAIGKLEAGITIKVKKKPYTTLPANVKKITDFKYPERNPPVRYRANIPTSWIMIEIHEGKNRQIRKMCASVGFPVLRLIRVSIGSTSSIIPIGEHISLSKEAVKKLTTPRSS